jgi:hypothetical protein
LFARREAATVVERGGVVKELGFAEPEIVAHDPEIQHGGHGEGTHLNEIQAPVHSMKRQQQNLNVRSISTEVLHPFVYP